MKLKHIGFFRELQHGDPNGPSLKSAVRPAPNYETKDIVKYLRTAPLLVASPGLVRDILDPVAPIIGAPNILTDGEWAWPEDLAHYVENYNVDLPQEFVRTLTVRAFEPPKDNQLDLSQLEL